MKVITEIKAQAKTPTRCNIYLDNLFYCGLELETVMRHGLKIGMQIEQEKLDEIQFDSELIRAVDKALLFLSRCKKTEKQVRIYLQKKGYTEQTIDAVIEKLADYKYVDDSDFAESYTKSHSKTKGRRLIEMELKTKGVSEKDLKNALENIGDQTKSALCVAKKYLKTKQIDMQNLQKCYRYLISKGFEYDVAKQVIERLKIDEDDLR